MKVTREKTENSQAFLSIEMEPAEVETALDKAYRSLVQKASIPGFRKGKAPRFLLEQHLGKERLLEEAVNKMAPEVAEKAIKEQDLKVVARPQVELEKMEPVTFKVVVPMEPTVNLGDYHQVKIAPESVEFKQEDVDAAVDQLRHNHATWEPVERPVAYADMVILDIESHIGEQPFINQKDAQFHVAKDFDYPMPGFADQLVELKVGDSKEFALKFPDDYGRAELAGKEASFKIKVNEVKQEKMPEVNDEFAKQVSPELENAEALKEGITTRLKIQAEDVARATHEKKVLDAVADLAQVEFPPVLVEHEIDHMIEDQMRRWQMSEKGLDEYLKNIKKTAEQLRDELRPMATKRVKQSIVLTKVAEQEKIEVKDEDIKAEIEKMTADMTKNKEEFTNLLNSPQSRISLANMIATRKTIARLVEIASGQASSAPEAQKEAKQ
ncbi:MAG: trigger factor [Dehalococcoidia bacterium]|nr:trigger factor [Dehalococcoidia bacterium]